MICQALSGFPLSREKKSGKMIFSMSVKSQEISFYVTEMWNCTVSSGNIRGFCSYLLFCVNSSRINGNVGSNGVCSTVQRPQLLKNTLLIRKILLQSGKS